ncbi:tyrosine-type recombinase/integrase [Fimbriiglobus ruber]|uniref:Tyr recombinase domain-containing protein n=1 Tax=Fimbriiglobus ruber TaxID=1908690 RepID=A0A225DHI1_9BACT|nr:site-specific integrase [Fimbriiglobus ruber]OWK40950.1 hypothetical protein FRUB_04842 [Fimbriiglobus ruber]
MAWLETKGDVFRIRFRYTGGKHLLALHTSDKREADDALARFGANLRLIERGIIDPPPEGADLGVYIVSGGKHVENPTHVVRPNRPTLATLFDRYVAEFPKAAKEPSTRKTEAIHIAHLRRLLDTGLPLVDVTSRTIQGYIDARSQEMGRRNKPVRSKTVKKELGTFSTVWNKWGIPQGLVATKAPVTNLTYPKETAKPPFQTRDQIERQIGRCHPTKEEQAELWSGLFLTLPEIEEVLDFVRNKRCPPYVYPMFVFAAHTGARRSEIRRTRVTDIDFTEKTILIREKKKDHSKEETYRTVPLTPRLAEAMQDWFKRHPGGAYAICTTFKNAIADHRATEMFRHAVHGSKWAVLPGWHCFRHSFISNCVAKGVDQRLIDHWVGHTTEEMRKRYSHLLPAASQTALLSVFGTKE